MRDSKDKVLKIVSELIGLFFSLRIYNPQVDVDYEEAHTVVTIRGTYEELDHNKLERFEELVQVSRQDELDEYYWNLAGNSHYPEFILLGTMVDSATIEKENHVLTVQVVRNHV